MVRIKLTKHILRNGDVVIDNDCSHASYSQVEKEYEQEIEIDDTKWREIKDE